MKVMDGIMDFEMKWRGVNKYNIGLPLLKEFFPGILRPEETKWWAGDCEAYDNERLKDLERGSPFGMAVRFNKNDTLPHEREREPLPHKTHSCKGLSEACGP